MTYENAAATRLLATHCAVCNRPLVDAESVETGMGPECRKKYGAPATLDETTRTMCNVLTSKVARDIDVVESIRTIRLLGADTLADKLTTAKAKIFIAQGGKTLTVTTPFSYPVAEDLRGVPGRQWDASTKVNLIPASSKHVLYDLLRKHFPGAYALGPKGLFQIPTSA